MPRAPKLASFPAIRGALRFYQICSIITGTMLLLLVAEMVVKYGFLGGDSWAGDVIAIAHGWVYVVYLVTVFDLWSRLRWPFGRFVVLVLSGVVPLLSFWAERRVVAEVRSGRYGPSVPATPGEAAVR
jgi:integral membrane protein